MGFISHTHHENGVTGVLCFHFAPQGKGKGKGPKGPASPPPQDTGGFHWACLLKWWIFSGQVMATLYGEDTGKLLILL